MALNIFPRRSGSIASAPTAEAAPTEAAPEPADEPAPKATTRTRRSTRSRSTSSRSTTGTRRTKAAEDEPESTSEPTTRTRGGRSRSRSTTARSEPDSATETDDEPEKAPRTRGRTSVPAADGPTDIEGQLKAQVKEIERQGRTLNRLTKDMDELRKLQRELLDRMDGTSSHSKQQRVGVFVDVANLELAADKLSRRLDWSKVLKRLTRDRQLVSAVAYSPVHEDLNVSLASQRFTEPFVDRGFRMVTKPLKKFSDGTVKANVDIEMTIEILEMVDRLDIVCLVSGDGDFVPLVSVVQSKGVRVEIVSIGNATAMALKRAGDQFIDLATILNEVGV